MAPGLGCVGVGVGLGVGVGVGLDHREFKAEVKADIQHYAAEEVD